MSKNEALARIGLDIIKNTYQFTRGLSPVSKHMGVVLHHMGNGRFTEDARNPGLVVHAMHLGNGWSGIGYHGIATQGGLYYTGRPYRNLGSHAGNAGNHLFGLLWFGGLKDQPSALAIETLAKAVAWVALDNGWEPSLSTVRFHSEVLSTECPGNLKSFRLDIIKQAREIMAQALNPKVEPVKPAPQATLPKPVTMSPATGLVNGHEVSVMIINGKAWFFGEHLGAQWNPDKRMAYITSASLPKETVS